MCVTNYTIEDDSKGGTTVDSVALRVMTQKDGCSCEVTLLNQQDIYTLYVRKYDLRINAAPENLACGLAIEMEYNVPNNLTGNKDPIECTKGTNTRLITL